MYRNPSSIALILPVGPAKEKLLRSAFKSAAEKIYFIPEGREPYSKLSVSIAQTLSSSLSGAVNKEIFSPIDFENTAAIVKAYTQIIEYEKSKDRNSRVILDISSTTNLAVLMSAILTGLYENVVLSYVRSKDYWPLWSKEEMEDRGEEYQLITTFAGKPLTYLDKKILMRIRQKQYRSISELSRELAKEEKTTHNSTYKRSVSRAINTLEARSLVTLVELEKKIASAVSPQLTDIGTGLVDGLFELRKSK